MLELGKQSVKIQHLIMRHMHMINLKTEVAHLSQVSQLMKTFA